MVSMRDQYDAAGPIILASDFPIFRDSLKAYLEQETDIEIIGCANREQEMIPLLQSSEPKLVVLDLKLEWEALCALLDQIHTTCSVRSLVMADGLDSSRVTQLILHGAHGVVPSCTTRELLTKSIHTVLAGGFWVSRATVTDFVALIRESASGIRRKTSGAKIENPEIPIAAVTTQVEWKRRGGLPLDAVSRKPSARQPDFRLIAKAVLARKVLPPMTKG